ncbi:MAG: hypothetical protein H0W84_06155 [Bacteroidetes bacterium]|nr:hypothetical protein [Bacteroidota bacterium]
MKISIKKLCNTSRVYIIRFYSLLFLFLILCGTSIKSQEETTTDNKQETLASEVKQPVVDVKNIKDNLAKIKEMQRKQAQEEILGYVFMVLGFGLVIAVAWFSTVKIKQITERKDEEKRKFLEEKIARSGGKISHRDPHRRGHRR